METFRNAVRIMRREWRAGALFFVALPLLALLVVLWLWVKEATWWELLLQGVIAIVVCAGAATAQALVMHRYSRSADKLTPARIAVVLVWCALFGAVLWYVSGWSDFWTRLTPYTYSKLSHGTRESIGFRNVSRFFGIMDAALVWWIVPALLLPLGVEWARAGLRRAEYRQCGRALVSVTYWAWLIVPAVIALWAPGTLVAWHPGKGLSMEMVSVAVRLTLAYVVAVVCWLFAIAVAAQRLTTAARAISALRDRSGKPAAQPA
jgi:hypothetical protein